MRNDVASHLHELMSENDKIWLITADLGFGLWDQIREDYPDRFLNTGASEQAASDICVGLALSGKIPVMYSITPFLLYRCFETWRTYANHENIKVILVGSGRNDDYKHDGFSHDASDDWKIFTMQDDYGNTPILNNFIAEWPINNKDASRALNAAIQGDSPTYINLTR